jgi:hypothetical protein
MPSCAVNRTTDRGVAMSEFFTTRQVRSGLAAIAIGVALGGCATAPSDWAPKMYSASEIVDISKGASPASVIQKLRDGRAAYAFTASEFVDLSKQGVANEVLDYLQQTQLAQLRREEQFYAQSWVNHGYWMGGRWYTHRPIIRPVPRPKSGGDTVTPAPEAN